MPPDSRRCYPLVDLIGVWFTVPTPAIPMNRNPRHGLFGFALAIAVSTTAPAVAQLPMPELFGPPPGPVAPDSAELDTIGSEAITDDTAAAKSKSGFGDVAPPMAGSTQAFEPKAIAERPAPLGGRPRLVDSIPSSSDLATELSTGKPTAKELRQARALYRQRQRIERLERNLWAGHEPLRPNWNSLPMTSSRYPAATTVLVPVYVYPR